MRLLSDPTRNDALVDLLRRHAPGARVLEVGCGTGLLSCIAAKLGARAVYAVEPTPLWEMAAAMVAENGLTDVVTVLPGRIEALPPRPVDLAFSELLNADPFVEGVLPAMDAAAAWVTPGGILAPRRLRVFAALARASGSAQEARAAVAEVRRLARATGLRTGALEAALMPTRPYVSISATEAAIGPATEVWSLELGTGARPKDLEIDLFATEAGPVGGVILWFTAELDDGFRLGSSPRDDGHWGCLMCAFAEERGVRAGGAIRVRLRVEDDRVDAAWPA